MLSMGESTISMALFKTVSHYQYPNEMAPKGVELTSHPCHMVGYIVLAQKRTH